MRPAPPQPGYTDADVTALIASRNFVFADCFTVELINGDKWYYTAAQRDVNVIPVDGSSVAVIFKADGPRLSGLKMHMEIGVNVDEQDLQISYTENDSFYGMVWGAAVASGILDGAIIRRDRFFAQSWFTPWVGGAPMFMGRVANIDAIERQDIKVKVKSYLVLANINMPKEVMQPACRNTLFDSRCTLNKAAFGVAGTVGASSNNSIIRWSGAVSTFTLGTISMVAGPAAGLSRSIKQATGTELILSYPFNFEPGLGDAFIAYPGCDKTLTTCTTQYSNVANHTGFPYVPPPETAA